MYGGVAPPVKTHYPEIIPGGAPNLPAWDCRPAGRPRFGGVVSASGEARRQRFPPGILVGGPTGQGLSLVHNPARWGHPASPERCAVTVVDHQVLRELLLRLEGRVHRAGWDEPPQIYVIYDSAWTATTLHYQNLMGRYGTAIHHGGYAARPILPAALLVGHPAHNLYQLAGNIGSGLPEGDVFCRAMNQPGLRAMATSVEVWARHALEGREEGRAFADTPGSREMRLLVAIDIAGDNHYVHRARGSDAEVGKGSGGGALFETMRYLVSRITGAFDAPFPSPPRGWSASASRS